MPQGSFSDVVVHEPSGTATDFKQRLQATIVWKSPQLPSILLLQLICLYRSINRGISSFGVNTIKIFIECNKNISIFMSAIFFLTR